MTPGTVVSQMATVMTVGALKGITPTENVLFYLAGNATAGDGTSGIYVWSPTATAAEDSSKDYITSSTVATGRWMRVKNRIDTLFLSMVQRKRIVTPAVAVGLSQDVAVTWDAPFASANYTMSVSLEGAGILGLPVPNIKSRTAAGCVITVRNTLLVALVTTSGFIHLTAQAD